MIGVVVQEADPSPGWFGGRRPSSDESGEERGRWCRGWEWIMVMVIVAGPTTAGGRVGFGLAGDGSAPLAVVVGAFEELVAADVSAGPVVFVACAHFLVLVLKGCWGVVVLVAVKGVG